MRNTYDTTALTVILPDLKKHLSKRGYSDTDMDPIITGITGAYRNEILILRITTNQNSKKKQVMVTKYNPIIKGLTKRIFKY